MYKRNFRLDKLIPAYLAEHPMVDASDIHAAISRVRPCSRQALFKMLRSLQDEGIVAKAGSSYVLQFSWVLELQELASKMMGAVLAPQALAAMIPEKGAKRSFTLPSLRDAGAFGTHLLLALLKMYPQSEYHEYTPFAFYHLANPGAESRFLKALRKMKRSCRLVLGSGSVVDRGFAGLLELHAPGSEILYVDRTRIRKGERYRMLIGDVALEARYAPRWTERYDRLMASEPREVHQFVVQCTRLVQAPGAVKITVSRQAAFVRQTAAFFTRLRSLARE